MRAHQRSAIFNIILLELAALSVVGCAADKAASTGGAEQAVVNPPLPGDLNLVLNARNTLTIAGGGGNVFGDVGASGRSGSVVFDTGALQDTSFVVHSVLANTVTVRAGASVGHVYGNDLRVEGSATQQSLGLDPTTLPQVPAATPSEPGTVDIAVGDNQLRQLCPGQYNHISVGVNSTLNLNGGVYQVNRLTLADGAHLEPSEPIVIVVAGGVNTGVGVTIAPSAQHVGIRSASDIRIEAGGAINLGDLSWVRAHLLAPNGKITIGRFVGLFGAVWANNIAIGESYSIRGEGVLSAVAPAVPPPCNDENSCTTDTCVGGGTTTGFCHNEAAPSGTSCDHDGVCQAGGVCDIPGEVFSRNFRVFEEDTTAQCDAWNDFLFNQLSNDSYSTVSLTGTFDPIGVTCSDPAAATQICQAMHNSATASVACDGHTWNVGLCKGGGELSVDEPLCRCFFGQERDIRPCDSSAFFGGVGTPSCAAEDQKITVVCQ